MSTRARLATALLPLALLAAPIAQAADPIGDVAIVQVWAYGTPVDGTREDLRRNSPVYADELIETVRTGEIRIEFVDGTSLAMGSESALVLDELIFDPATADTMKIELVSGFFHFVTGSVDKEAVAITTPSMVIGVRGTDLAISVGADGTTEVGVRDGTATATPTAGGETVDIATGQTGKASPGDRSIGVSAGLSAAALGTMPASGSGVGRGSPASPAPGEADINREGAEHH